MSAERQQDLPQIPEAASSNIIAYAGFDALPIELRQTIIDLACHVPQTKSSHWLRPRFDLALLSSLCLVSRTLNQQTRQLLLYQVCITRPSSLYALCRLLEAHLDRAQLVKHLHIGAQKPLPLDWWPLSKVQIDGKGASREKGQADVTISSSLDETVLPSGLESKVKFSLHHATAGCRGAAIYDALQEAQRQLEINLLEADAGSSSSNIDSAFLVQAALDLYLLKVRAIEDANPQLVQLTRPGARVPAKCRKGKCDHYPGLVVTETSASAANDKSASPAALVVTRSELLRHLARPGSVTDRFDHPLMLARSGFEVKVIPPSDKEPKEDDAWRRSRRGARYETRTVKWDLLKEKDWEGLAALREEDERESSAALNALLINTATIGSHLRLARQVLSRTTKLENLSLSGHLERTVGNGEELHSSVKRLSLGPPPPWWYLDLDLEGLEHIVELRIGGTALSPAEVDALLKFYQLKKLEWSLGEPYAAEHRWTLVETLTRLAKARLPDPPYPKVDWETTLAQAAAQGKAIREGRPMPSFRRERTAKIDGPPLVLARLDTSNVGIVLGQAPNKETQDAWLHGTAVKGQARKLRLLAKMAEWDGEDEGEVLPSRDCTSDFWEWLYQEGRDWWLKGSEEGGS